MSRVPYISVVVVASITIVAGILHGNMIGRWGAGADAQRARDLIEEIPSQIGVWELKKEDLSTEAERQLRCHGYIYGTFINKNTGQTASIAFLLGPPGPIAVHTPEICFSSRDFRPSGNRKAVTVEAADGTKNKFWSLGFKSKRIDAGDIHVVYAWNGGEGWTASKSPRWEYSGAPYLYKLQIVCEVNDRNAEGKNPCEAFLEDFLPVANQHIQFGKAE